MKKKERVEGAVYGRNYVYNFHYHLIWVTKYRQQAFSTPELAEEMKQILLEQAALSDVTVETMEVMPDHIHMLIGFKPKYAPSDIVKALKGHSAKIFFKRHPEIRNQRFWGGHLWSHSYYMSTVGVMSKEVVERYIRNQHTK